MIRALAARNLSARQKSNIRNIAYRLGGYVRRPVEVLVEDVVLQDNARTFLQIGANDGYLSDPLNLAIFRHRLTGTFVEPQANYYRELQRTYRDFPGMVFLQYAVAENNGAMTMYTLDCSSGRLPGWAHGVGTLSREQIEKFGDQIANIDAYIRASEVQCVTVADLLDRAAHRDPDIIVVDAEGFDHVILSQFDFAKLSTKLVIYETESMAEKDAADLTQRLEAGGFAIFEAGQDTIALKRDTETFRRKTAADSKAA
ncbi:FkbM family methyltransferase [Bradyrhizobium sp. Ash2021]|uniref:FkbM family methyltransferase n=1 Tax=Bradyrhizobium sp. Ash2021 TaxID=2954771 RepID=UPI002815D416|nr:FkbM family methyltransferase [Bradyrhizobium sp. Ash2021]WMT71008.1 FkbM family methyltransferase [Bradyrhizobium sp. Ash2021]